MDGTQYVIRSMTIDVIKPAAAKHSRADMMQRAEYERPACRPLETKGQHIQA
jgi:hypothetical protein